MWGMEPCALGIKAYFNVEMHLDKVVHDLPYKRDEIKDFRLKAGNVAFKSIHTTRKIWRRINCLCQ